MFNENFSKEVDRCVEFLSQSHIGLFEKKDSGYVLTEKAHDAFNEIIDDKKFYDIILKHIDKGKIDFNINEKNGENTIDCNEKAMKIIGYKIIAGFFVKKFKLKKEMKNHNIGIDLLESVIASMWKATHKDYDVSNKISRYIS